MIIKSKKSVAQKTKKFYTFNVSVSFEMQFTFGEKEVQPAEEGGENDFEPTEKALADLEKELNEYLSQNYIIDKLESVTDFDSLLCVVEEPVSKTSSIPPRKPVQKKPLS